MPLIPPPTEADLRINLAELYDDAEGMEGALIRRLAAAEARVAELEAGVREQSPPAAPIERGHGYADCCPCDKCRAFRTKAGAGR